MESIIVEFFMFNPGKKSVPVCHHLSSITSFYICTGIPWCTDLIKPTRVNTALQNYWHCNNKSTEIIHKQNMIK